MKYGSTEPSEFIDFSLPEDHKDTSSILKKGNGLKEVYIGSAKWSKDNFKNFYPASNRDNLSVYAQKFNSVEVNATFYNNYPPEQIIKWSEKTPEGFKFFPRVPNYISHIKRLIEVDTEVDTFINSIKAFGPKLGTVYLQLHSKFNSQKFEKIERFVQSWPSDIPLGIELRNKEWFTHKEISKALFHLLEKHKITNIITDSTAKRELLHMRLTTPTAYIRFISDTSENDYDRLDQWLDRVHLWSSKGLENLYFFVHHTEPEESSMLTEYFIDRFNNRFESQIGLTKTNR